MRAAVRPAPQPSWSAGLRCARHGALGHGVVLPLHPGRQGHHSSAALAVVPLWGLGEQAEADLSELKSERKMS